MKPCTRTVLELLRSYDGVCPRTFATFDIYRYGARIFELRHDHGYEIGTRRCSNQSHWHRRRIDEYYLEGDGHVGAA